MALTKHQQKLKNMRKQMREDEKVRYDAAEICMNVLSVVPAYVMLESFGWKRKRLSRFVRRYAKVMKDVNERKIKPEALADEILQQTGIKYDNGDWYDTKG